MLIFWFILTAPINNDACLSNPCQHDGSCTNTPGEENPYKCECKPGFLGQNCEGIYFLFAKVASI